MNGFTCAIEKDSELAKCWGANNYGQSSPPSTTKFIAIAVGSDHSCGIEKDTYLAKCWGRNNAGGGAGKSSPPSTTKFVAIAVGMTHSCGIEKDSDHVKCWGSTWEVYTGYPDPAAPAATTKFVAIAAGHRYTCGIEKDTYLAKCWGSNSNGQSTPPSDTKFVAISAQVSPMGGHTCGIEKDTELAKCWGNPKPDNGQSTPPSDTKFAAISAGEFHTCGIEKDTEVAKCWGYSTKDRTTPPAGVKFVTTKVLGNPSPTSGSPPTPKYNLCRRMTYGPWQMFDDGMEHDVAQAMYLNMRGTYGDLQLVKHDEAC